MPFNNFFESKLGQFLLDVLRKIFLPKFANWVTKTLIGLGIVLLTASQSLFTAGIISVAESFFGKLDFLREVYHSNQMSPEWGFSVLLLGIIYHLAFTALTVWQEKHHFQPEKPSFSTGLTCPDGTSLEGTYEIPGFSINVKNKNDIPDFRVSAGKLGIGMQAVVDLHYNSSYYRDMASYLEKWSGVCVFRINVTNSGKSVASSVRLEIHFDPANSVTFWVARNLDTFPEEKALTLPVSYNNLIHSQKPRELEIHNSNGSTYIAWDIGDLQPSRQVESEMFVAVKCHDNTICKTHIFCNEMPERVESPVQLVKPTAKDICDFAEMSEDKFYDYLYTSFPSIRDLINEERARIE